MRRQTRCCDFEHGLLHASTGEKAGHNTIPETALAGFPTNDFHMNVGKKGIRVLAPRSDTFLQVLDGGTVCPAIVHDSLAEGPVEQESRDPGVRARSFGIAFGVGRDALDSIGKTGLPQDGWKPLAKRDVASSALMPRNKPLVQLLYRVIQIAPYVGFRIRIARSEEPLRFEDTMHFLRCLKGTERKVDEHVVLESDVKPAVVKWER